MLTIIVVIAIVCILGVVGEFTWVTYRAWRGDFGKE